ncbi:glycosyltransferase [Undibacterium baiyunense]|uniref:Glycosyltransferase family 4 protein n=1 Tax=Undibacterium baiyunense TaxID=2828731 RepID=A0A941DDL4_9BURK|nr:glycosyltransferase family 4 protein [Undibacterium baiyunense]MBR7745713.1 glycosyltransferase family 4 protein [Undibacterium baiyunense]
MHIQKVLYLGYVWPEPNSSAAGSRTMAFLRLFRAQNWQVIFASVAALSPHRADLSALQIEEKQLALNCDSFDQFVRDYQPDLVVFDRFFTEEQFAWRVERQVPNALRLLDTCDLHSLREARHQLLKQALQAHPNERERQAVLQPSSDRASLVQQMAQSDLALREIAAIYRCDLSLMISRFETELLRDAFALPSYLLCENNLMLTVRTGSTSDFQHRQGFVSIGNFRHAPNWDAVLYLKQAVWPRLRAKMADAQIDVYGSYPPPKAIALHQPEQGFYVRGWADDAQQVMAAARVCLAPIRFGAGIKGKLADAMAAGTPSVTTPIGAESMHGDLHWGGAIADHLDDFVDAAIRLASDQSEWRLAQQRGQQILQQHFDYDTAASDFIGAILQAREQQAVRRLQNFTGAMLRHHSMKSTQYMSQWIQLKNQGTTSDPA